MAIDDYFEKPEKQPTEEYQLESPIEEKPTLEERLKDMLLNPSEIPEGWDREKVIAVLKEHRQLEKEQVEREKAETKKKELSEETKKMLRVLGARPPANKFAGEEIIEDSADAENRKAWNELQEMKKAQEQANFNRTHRNFPTGIKEPEKPLNELSLEQRTRYFEKLGLISKNKKYTTEKR